MLQVACSKRSLLPAREVCLHGYGARNYRSNKVEDPVELSCMALAQGKQRWLIFTIDCIGMDRLDCAQAYKKIAQACDVGFPNILICCSHTHFAPAAENIGVTVPGGEMELGIYRGDQEFLDSLLQNMQEAAEEALASLRNASVEYVVIPLPAVAFNRRTINKSDKLVSTNYTYPKNPDEYHFQNWDDNMSVWRFRHEDETLAILTRFSCHPVTGGSLGSEYISGDYPSHFRRSVEELFGCPAFFMLGAAGDVVPMQRQGQSRQDLGEIMARSIRLNERRFRKIADFSLQAEYVTLPMRLRLEVDRKGFQLEYEELLKQARQSETLMPEFVTASSDMLQLLRYPENEVELPLQIVKFGDHVLVAMPFECLSSIGRKLQAQVDNAILVSISGGYQGYLPLQEEYAQLGYECSRNHFKPDAGDRFVAAAVAKIKELGF